MKNRLNLAPAFLIVAGQRAMMPTMAQNDPMTEPPFSPVLSEPTDGNLDIATARCFQEELIPFDQYIHKSLYKVAVHSNRDITVTQLQFERFGDYLTQTAGQRFDPPIKFEISSLFYEPLLNAIDNRGIDFFFSNPTIYTCVGTEKGASALATSVKHVEVRNHVYDLDVYGGVIATRADNDEIKTITDLKDKIIGAGAIVDLMGAQMQIYEMKLNNISYVNDPTQFIFMRDQANVIESILSGRIDAGFIRTSQIELTKDKDGNHLSIDLFKVVHPKVHVLENGELFPFLHSTEILPEWPLAALSTVPKDVALEVQRALLEFGKHAAVGKRLAECGSSCSDSSQSLQDLFPDIPLCGATPALVQLAYNASLDSALSGFRTAQSYHEITTLLQDAGFMVQDDRGEWQCTRPSNLYEGITCPEGFFRRSEVEFWNGCAHEGRGCDEVETYECFCKPCIKAFDVDVYEIKEGEVDSHLVDDFAESYPGCEKMQICAKVVQNQYVTMRIHDNMMRENATVKIIQHSAESTNVLNSEHLEGTYAYEFKLMSRTAQAQVIEVMVNGKPIGQSPIRIMVLPNNCAALYGAGSHREPDSAGNCVCANNTYEMMGACIESAYFFLIIFSAVFIFVGVSVFFYLAYKRKQNDQVWHINVEELHFNEPPEVIGQGAFGVVVLGQYRGTKVAVKRVLPPAKKSRGSSRLGSVTSDGLHSDGLHSGSFQRGSLEIGKSRNSSIEMDSKKARKQMKKKDKTKGKDDDEKPEKEVKFGETSGDIEEGVEKNRESLLISSSKTDWEKLSHMHQSDNVLKLLESATASNHGSGTWGEGYGSHQSVASKVCPLWLQFDQHARLKKDFIVEMRLLSRLRHPCITTVMGAVIAPTVDPMLVMEYMEYGSLYDLLHNETMSAGGDIILQIVRDITQGIQFLHASKPPILHGDLKAKNILVDSRFRAKVADFGFSHFKMAGMSKTAAVLQGTPFFMAPEYLRRKTEYTAACDIYSLGMILLGYARQAPFEGEDPRKILPKVCSPRINKRPTIPDACPPRMADIIKKCWSANPFFRPTAKDLDYALVEMSARDTEPLESFQNTFKEGMKRKATSLYDVFPKHIADALNAGKKVEAETHDCVTVVFSDIVGFTTISETFSPLKVSNMLDRLYQAFDTLSSKHGVFKVETIGDAYMGVTNLDGTQVDDHVKRIALYAQDAIVAASKIPVDDEDLSRGYVKIRVGFHSGPVVSNVIGSLNPRYGLFGDTVNTASRMESNSMEGRIQCTQASAELLVQQAPEIPVMVRGKIKVKGKGTMRTYWVGTLDPTQLGATLDPVTELNDETTNHDETTNQEDDGVFQESAVGDSHSSQDGTHKTHSISLSTDDDDAFYGSPPLSPTSNDKQESDHIIKVHTSGFDQHHQATRISMDGAVGTTEGEEDGEDEEGAVGVGGGVVVV